MASGSPFRLLHASLAVADLDRSIGFYRDAFGYRLTLMADDVADLVAGLVGRAGLGCRLAQLSRPGTETVLELIEFHDEGDRPASGRGRVPLAHLAFAVPDLDGAMAAFRALGAEPLGYVVAFPEGRCVYCREPGGSVFELEEAAE